MRVEMMIHQRGLEIVGRYLRAEAELIDILQQADRHKVYLHYDCRSLHQYAIKKWKLTESVASNFITVARKAVEVPALKDAIESGALSVSKARKVTPVLNRSNQEEWLEKAVSLPQLKLEREVAKAFPKEAVPEKLKYVSDDRLNLQVGVSDEFREMLRRVQDLESQRQKKAVSLEEALHSALHVYLEKKDPVVIAERLKKRKHLRVARHIDLRDRGQCTYVDGQGLRCSERRWLHTHHIIPRSQGGPDTLENLTTLCSGHHRQVHSRDRA